MEKHSVPKRRSIVCRRRLSRVVFHENFFEMKAAKIDDQVKIYSDKIHRLAEDRCQNLVSFENLQRRLLEGRKLSQKMKESLDELQSKVKDGRVNLSGLQIQLQKERFDKKSSEEELEAAKRKASLGASRIQRNTQVVIAKCYQLLCNPCVPKVIETRHRKCPVCVVSFGPNDVKPIYI